MSQKTQRICAGIYFACGLIYFALAIIAYRAGVFDDPTPYRTPLTVAYTAAWAITIVFFLIPDLYRTKEITIGTVFIVLLAPATLTFAGFYFPFMVLGRWLFPRKNPATA